MNTMTEPLVIPNDVHLVPVADLPDQVRDQLEWSDGDVAVTRLRSRMPSKVVNADLAALLNEFQTEKTIVEAIVHYSLTQSTDPHELLESAFPVLKQFVGYGLLVPPQQADQGIERSLERNEQLDTYRIVRKIRSLQDTEIYLAKTPDGTTVALKIKQPRAESITDRVLQHEAYVLEHLNGEGVPYLIGQGTWNDRAYLAISWCNGIDVMRAATERRDHRDRLLNLCIDIADRYAYLHAQGVMHGDIHPGNVLVDASDSATLIDFGLASAPDQPAPYRGGVAFYFEPEYAEAFLEKRRPPNSSSAGEQYAVAALLYQLITGSTYLNFSLEEDLLYRQIVEETPQPFSTHGIEPWPEVEAVLTRALSKNPADRFSDVAAFADALRAVNTSGDTTSTPPSTNPLLDDVLEQLQLGGALLREGLPRRPHASVNYGTAGIAYTLYRLAGLREDPRMLALADVWLTRAELAVGDDDAFYEPELDMGVDTLGRISPFHTPSGIHTVRFLIARAMGDMRSQLEALMAYVQAADQPCDTLDVTLGKAGVVLNSAMLYEALSDVDLAERSGLTVLGNKTLDALWSQIDTDAPIGPESKLRNLGAAHGWSGLLYATLRWHQATGAPLPDAFFTRLDELAGQAEETGRGVQWLWEFGRGEGYMSGWCNGSAGHLYLWTLAYRVFGDDRYLGLAVRIGWNVWEDPAVAGTLCCGLAGRSFSLIHLYQITGNVEWLERAHILADRAAHHIRHSQTEEYEGFEMSLFKGDLGVALLLGELECPDQTIFPLWESEFV